MYKIHRQGQPLKKDGDKPPMNSFFSVFSKKKDENKVEEKKNEKDKEKDSEESEKTECIRPPVVVQIEDDEEMRRLERKKRSQEDMVADFVKILEQMMNPRQAVTSFVSAATGLGAVIVAVIYVNSLPESAVKAKELVTVLIVYGILQVLLATAFFVTCMQTSIAVSKGVKDALQIIVGLLVALIYVAIALISLVVGIYGFYKTLCLVSYVEYVDTTALFYCPQPIFYTSLVVFILHIILIVLKCCCCK